MSRLPIRTVHFVAVSVFAASAAIAQTGPSFGSKPVPIFANGMAQVVPAFADSSTWIRQELWVETNFDSDNDGKPDRVHVDVTRPRETDQGLKLSIIYGSSPYYAGTARGQVNWNVQQELNAEPEPRGHDGVAAVSGKPHAHLERARE